MIRKAFIHFIFLPIIASGQVNLVANPSFELRCGSDTAYSWSGADSANCSFWQLHSECSQNNPVPLNNWTFQYPHSGKNYLLGTAFIFDTTVFTSYYLKNRLRLPLQKNSKYCVRYFLNIANISTYSYDAYDVSFSNSPDTLSGNWPCWQPITFLNPQVSNAANSIISDTLNWTAMSGTFTASGGEKYLIFGNLRGVNVNTLCIYTNTTLTNGSDICLDDFSVVDIDLPADAGPDKKFFSGDSVYIGRPLDVGTDYACTWYKLPQLSAPIATASGIWVKPTQTATYVVRQQLWCSGVKWDTVVVYLDALGLKGLDAFNRQLDIYPNPANDFVNLKIQQSTAAEKISSYNIWNALGQQFALPEYGTCYDRRLDIRDLQPGTYTIKFELHTGETVVRKFVVME